MSAWIYAAADYDLLELRCLAQACIHFGLDSALGRAINEGRDVHLQLAAEILQISYDDAVQRKADPDVAEARQLAKVPNFGVPGGLGAEKLALFARKSMKREAYIKAFGETKESAIERARELKDTYLRSWPEMKQYFKIISDMCGPEGATVRHFGSGRLRGGATYTAACNSFFQGLGSDATGRALWLVSKACYVPSDSPLYGCRIVNYIHDEIITECPEDRGYEVALEMVRLMIEGANEFLPDVPATAEPKLMRYWSKDAKVVKRDGKLIPWPDRP